MSKILWCLGGAVAGFFIGKIYMAFKMYHAVDKIHKTALELQKEFAILIRDLPSHIAEAILKNPQKEIMELASQFANKTPKP